MRFVVAAILAAVLCYMLSFAVYNWQNKNRLAAIGAAILGMVACGITYFVLFFGNYEL